MIRALAALAGAAIILLVFATEFQKGTAYEVRYAWMDMIPAFFLLISVVGFRLERRGWLATGAALTWSAIGALVVHASLVVIVPLQPGDLPLAQLWPALEIGGILLFVALLRARSRLRSAWPLIALGVALGARAVARIISDPLAPRFVGTGLTLGALVTACLAFSSLGMAKSARDDAR